MMGCLRIALAVCLALPFGCAKRRDEAPPATTELASDGRKPTAQEPSAVPPARPIAPVPLGLPDPTPVPEDERDSAERVALGARLFFDTRLSESGRYACATCHQPDKGWGDGKATSVRHDGRRDSRHTPTLYNAAYAESWYWDGRALTLEAQILDAWTDKLGGKPAATAARLEAVSEYAERFRRAFGAPPTPRNIPRALASFVRTATRNGDSPWDRYERAGDPSQVSASTRAGFEIFTSKANCALCHAPPLYTDGRYHALGVGDATEGPRDPGRGALTQVPRDYGAFKTPTLRGVADHPPYLHDGSAATLEDAVDAMLAAGSTRLTERERADLLEFLRALGSTGPAYAPPRLP